MRGNGTAVHFAVSLFIAILCIHETGAQALGSLPLSLTQLHSMLDGLKREIVGKYVCSVAGGGDVDECDKLMDVAPQAPSVHRMLLQFAEPATGPALYEQRLLEGVGAVRKLSSRMSSLTGMADMLIEAAEALEASFVNYADDFGGASDMGVYPSLSPAPSGFLKDVPVNYDECGMNLPPDMESVDYAGSMRERSRVISELRDAKTVLCNRFKERVNNVSRTAQGFLFYGNVKGYQLTYPASSWTSPLRYSADGNLKPQETADVGFGFNVLFQEWFQTALSMKKDMFVVVHCSSSVSSTAWTKMVKELRLILSVLLTFKDYIGLDLGTSYALSADKAACFTRALRRADAERKRIIDDMIAGLRPGGSNTRDITIRIQDACSTLLSTRLAGKSSGGPQYLLLISDGVVQVNPADLTCAPAAAAMAIPFPVPDLHFIGFSVGDEADASLLQAVACRQAGVWWRIHSGDEPLSSFLNFIRDFTSLVIETDSNDPNTTTDSSGTATPGAAGAAMSASTQYGPGAGGGKRHITWLPTRIGSHNTPRPVLQVSVAVYKSRAGQSRLEGVLASEMSVDWILDELRAAIAMLPVFSADGFVIYHDGMYGELLVHTRGHLNDLHGSSYDLHLSDEDRLRAEQHVSSYEGEDFVTSGILDRIVKEDEGWATHRRRKWHEHERVFYQQRRLVTYFWKRIPRTGMTAVLAVQGSPIPNTTAIIHDDLVNSEICGAESTSKTPAAPLTPPLCWGNDGPLTYHRYDTMTSGQTGTGAGQGGEQVASGQAFSSSFAVASRAYNDAQAFNNINWQNKGGDLIAKVIQLQQQVNSPGTDAAKFDTGVVGSGIRLHALQELRMSGSVRAIWKEALKSKSIKDAVWGLAFATDTGILHTSPALLVDDSIDPITLDWYMQAATHYHHTVAVPPRALNSSTCPPGSVCAPLSAKQQRTGDTEWIVTLSRAAMHSKTGQRHPSQALNSIETSELVGAGRLFGVAAVHLRLEQLVSSFIASTKLPSGTGCGDQRGLTDDTFCYLIDYRARVVVSPAMIAAMAAGKPLAGILRDLDGDSLTDLSSYEPIIVQRLMASEILATRTDAFRNAQFGFVEVNETALQEYAVGKVIRSRNYLWEWPPVKGLPLSTRGAGVTFTIASDSRDAHVFLHELAGTKLFLLAVQNYSKSTIQPFCGPLSRLCPDVLRPLAYIRIRPTSLCGNGMAHTDLSEDWKVHDVVEAAATTGQNASTISGGMKDARKVAAGFYKLPIDDARLRALRASYRHAQDPTQVSSSQSGRIDPQEWLDCPYDGLSAWIVLVIAAGVLLVMLCIFLIYTKRVYIIKARLAVAAYHVAEEKGVYTRNDTAEEGQRAVEEKDNPSKEGESLVSSQRIAECMLAADVGGAGLRAFRPLQEMQAQIVENLWTRDSGSTAQLEKQIEVLNDEVGAMVAQFDFMQQRVQSQDVIGGAVQRMQRRCTRYLQEISQWEHEIEELVQSGNMQCLDQSLVEDLTELSERHSGMLPRGTREAVFYKHNLAKKLQVKDPLKKINRADALEDQQEREDEQERKRESVRLAQLHSQRDGPDVPFGSFLNLPLQMEFPSLMTFGGIGGIAGIASGGEQGGEGAGGEVMAAEATAGVNKVVLPKDLREGVGVLREGDFMI